jgi:hypothetical protein
VTRRVVLLLLGALRAAPIGRLLWPVSPPIVRRQRGRTDAAVTAEASASAPAVAAHAAV